METRLRRLWRPVEICTNTKVDMEKWKETRETVETSGDMYKYKGGHGDMEEIKETRETVDTSGDMYKYLSVHGDMERLKDTI